MILVLKRKRDESIVIGEVVTVKILRVRGKDVWVGIDAPKGVPVHREEIHEKIQAERRGDKPKPAPAV